MVSNAGIVIASVTYFTALAVLLSLAGYATTPPALVQGFGGSTDTTGGSGNFFVNSFTCIGQVFTFGLLGFDGCQNAGAQVGSFFTHVAEALAGIINAIFGILFFFFQFFSFSLPIPIWLQVMMLFPFVAGMGYVGIRVFRGGG